MHFLQIWVVPDRRGLAPSDDQKAFDLEAARRGFVELASGAPTNGAVHVQQDVAVWMARLGGGDERVHRVAPGRHAWVHVARGPVTLNGRTLAEGDSAALSDEPEVRLVGQGDAEVLLFDLA